MWGLKFSGEERGGRMMKCGRVGRTCVCGKSRSVCRRRRGWTCESGSRRQASGWMKAWEAHRRSFPVSARFYRAARYPSAYPPYIFLYYILIVWGYMFTPRHWQMLTYHTYTHEGTKHNHGYLPVVPLRITKGQFISRYIICLLYAPPPPPAPALLVNVKSFFLIPWWFTKPAPVLSYPVNPHRIRTTKQNVVFRSTHKSSSSLHQRI